MPRRADFVIIGAMKCATSTLCAQLARQSGLYINEKELNFFSNDEAYAQGISWYERFFKDAQPGEICGESSTHYTKLPTYPCTVQRMTEFLPYARLIYLMRHPIDRLISHYTHEWTQRTIELPIDQAINQHPELVAYSQYAMQIEPFLNSYGPEKILPVFFERLCERPQQELERICRFVGLMGPVNWYDEPPRNVSRDRMRASPLRDAIIEFPPFAVLRRTLVPKALRTKIRSLWTLRRRPQIPPTQHKQLIRLFNADLDRLSNWFEFKISCETFQEVATQDRLKQGWAQGLYFA